MPRMKRFDDASPGMVERLQAKAYRKIRELEANRAVENRLRQELAAINADVAKEEEKIGRPNGDIPAELTQED